MNDLLDDHVAVRRDDEDGETRQMSQTFTRRKSLEQGLIMGWWEGSAGSLVTLTAGKAHIVHRGRAFAMSTPPEQFSSNAETVFDKVARFLR